MSVRPQPSIDRLRNAIVLRVQATSLRAVARQVGMSPSGLDKFLSGGTPYTKSRRKLFDWLHRERHNLHSDLTADGMAAALGALVRDLAPDRREGALHTLLGTLRDVYGVQPDTAPPWLGQLASMTEDGTAFHEDDVPRAGPSLEHEDGEHPATAGVA